MSSLSSRVRTAVVVLASGAALVLGCNQGAEGDRCNPDRSHDECGSGLKCTQPVDCPESYCCPIEGHSTDPYCQPGCAGGQASICAAGGDADCASDAADADTPTSDGGGG